MKGNRNKCYLMEYKIVKKLIEINIEFIGKGKDFCSEISCIQAIDSDTVITANKLSYIKIWKKTEKRPIIFQNDESDPENDLDEEDKDYYPSNFDNMSNNNNISNYYPSNFDNKITLQKLNDNSFQMKDINYFDPNLNFNNRNNNKIFEYENSLNSIDNSFQKMKDINYSNPILNFNNRNNNKIFEYDNSLNSIDNSFQMKDINYFNPNLNFDNRNNNKIYEYENLLNSIDNDLLMSYINYSNPNFNFNDGINNKTYEYENSLNLNDNSKMNIIFQLPSGISFPFLVKKNMTICEILKLFAKNFNLEEDVIDKEIIFIYNALKIGLNNNKKIEHFFYDNNKIVVIDSKNILGKKKFITFYINEQKYNIPINEKENMFTLVKKYIEIMGITEQEGKIDFLKEIDLVDFFKKLSNNSLNEK